MRRFLFLVFVCAIRFGSPPVYAESNDPSDMFLNAYMSVQQGEQLEHDGKYKPALAKYRYATSLLDQIHEKFPNWQPLIVDYRKKRTAENIGKLQEKIASLGPDAGAGLPEATPGAIEPALPQSEPSISLSPSGSGTTGDLVDQATQGIKDRIAQLQKDLNDSRNQLKSVQQEKEEISSRLDTALKELDKVKVSDAENKAKLKQVQEQLKNATADNTSTDSSRKAMQDEIARLQSALADAHADRDAADQVNGDTARRLAKARRMADATAKERDAATAKTKDLEAKFADAAKLAHDLETAEKKIASLTKDRDAADKSSAEMTGKLADAQKQLASIGKERDAARKQSEQLNGKLAEAKKQIEAAGRERDAMAKQRDLALADLAKAKSASKQVDKLITENATLMQKLGDAEKTIAQFNTDTPKKDAEIASLKKEVGEVKNQLVLAQKQSKEFQSSMLELQTQFDNASSELAELKATAVGSEEKKKLTDENDLLRGIVLRQLKEQARRDQSKKLIVEELSKRQVQSDTLMQQLDYLGQPIVKLTDKEKALFKQPQIEISDADISIAAPKPQSSAPPGGNGKLAVTGTHNLAGAPTSSKSDVGEDLPIKDPMLAKKEPQTKPDAAPAVETAPVPNVPKDVLPLASEAKDHFDRGEYLEAEKIYLKMLSKIPNNVYILSNLGVSYYREGKMKLAEEMFNKAIAIAPGDSFSECTLGIVYYSQGKYDDAVKALTKALAIKPKYAVAHNYLGITASQKGWQEAATKELETAIQIDPDYADALFNLAVVYITHQPPNKELASKYYKRAIDRGAVPDSALEELIK